jgi:hypothetical protein
MLITIAFRRDFERGFRKRNSPGLTISSAFDLAGDIAQIVRRDLRGKKESATLGRTAFGLRAPVARLGATFRAVAETALLILKTPGPSPGSAVPDGCCALRDDNRVYPVDHNADPAHANGMSASGPRLFPFAPPRPASAGSRRRRARRQRRIRRQFA